MGFSGGAVVKNLPANAEDARDTGQEDLPPQVRKIPHPRSGRSPGEGNGNPLPYSCLENPMNRGALQATVHRVALSDTTE